VRPGARVAEQLEDAGREVCLRHTSARGRREAKGHAGHPGVRGRGAAHLLLLASSLTALGLALAPAVASAEPLAPESPQSPNADDITVVYWIMLVIATLIALAINAALIAAVVRFRAARGRTATRLRAGRRVQARVGAGLAAVAAVILVLGIVFTVQARDVAPGGPEGLQASSSRTAQLGVEAPSGDVEPLEVLVSGQQWLWRFEYPDGTFSYYQLVVPVDTPVLLRLESTDVVHRWWIPALGGKFDAVPGRANETWFMADEEGTYEGQSAAFSGASYPTMRARVAVVSATEYEAWLDRQAADIQAAQEFVQQQVQGEGGGT
jgi:cytochrome c oxidase subunit 2